MLPIWALELYKPWQTMLVGLPNICSLLYERILSSVPDKNFPFPISLVVKDGSAKSGPLFPASEISAELAGV